MKKGKNLAGFWSDFKCKSAPFIHPKDRKSPHFSKKLKKLFRLSLLPVPYIGNLDHANIIILMGNPGFHKEHDIPELKDKVFQRDIKLNNRQKLKKYPFFYLKPEYRKHGGGIYWRKRLKDIADTLVRKGHFPSDEAAFNFIAKKIAVVQLAPYHSSKFPRNLHLPSTQRAIDWANNKLLRRAQKGKISIIVARGWKDWRADKWKTSHQNIAIHKRRGASFKLSSQGGKLPGGDKMLKALIKIAQKPKAKEKVKDKK